MKAFRKFAWLFVGLLLLLGMFNMMQPKQVEAAGGDHPDIYIYKYKSTDLLDDVRLFNGEEPSSDYDITTAPNMTGKVPIPGIVFELKLIKRASNSTTYQSFKEGLTEPNPFDARPIYAVTDANGVARFDTMADEHSGEYVIQGSPYLLFGVYELREIAASEYQMAHDYMAYHMDDTSFPTAIPAGIIPNTKIYRLEMPYYTKKTAPYEPNPSLSNDENAEAEWNHDVENGNAQVVDLHVRAKNQDSGGMIRIEKDLRANPLKETLTVQSNIRFKLYDSNYTEITTIPTTGAPIGELVTDSNGRLTISGLALGATYYLKEVAPTGTIPEKLGYRKFIASTLDTDTLSIDDTTTPSKTGQFINNTITKRVSADEGQTFEKESVVSTEKPYLYQIAARVPDKGEGTLEEFKLVDKMQKVEEKYYTYFQSNASLDTLTDLTVKVNGTFLEASQYTVHIADTDKQAVANQGNETKVVGFTLTFNNPADLHAGDKVEVRVKGILINETITKETRTVYPNEVKEQVSTKHQDGTEDHYVISDVANVRTEKGYFEIIKEEATTNKRLANAEFTLYRGKAPASLADVKPTDKVVEGLVTDENGEYKSKTDTTHTYTVNGKTLKLADGLSLGEYYLVETLAPTGHKRITTPIALEIKKNEQGNVVVKTITNEVQYWDVPDTGGIGTQYFLLIGLMSVTTFAVWYLYKEKSRTNEK